MPVIVCTIDKLIRERERNIGFKIYREYRNKNGFVNFYLLYFEIEKED